ncbi:MAG: methionyl-tRNA formyltransferase [Oscillatoriales cyanobacterium SM2_2_1]|nr:methionyl-tRNA formyltransferase [Oscillatoriales cyanobacterium SM2_2_1]
MTYRLVFFGTPEFAVPTLAALAESADMEIVGVVTQPDARRSRRGDPEPSPVKSYAQGHGLGPIWQPERLRRDRPILDALTVAAADFFVVVAYGQILSPEVLSLPRLGCINIHGSLLPKYRGAAPIQWAIARGETLTGITTMLMDEGIDTGAMLLTATQAIAPDTNAETLAAQLASLGAALLLKTLRCFASLTPTPQNGEEATNAPLITKEDLIVSWSEPAKRIHDRIRAFYPQCYTTFGDQRLKILATRCLEPQPANASQSPGQIEQISKQGAFTVQTGSGLLEVLTVQAAGKKVQTAWEFANGARLQVGDRLGDSPA